MPIRVNLYFPDDHWIAQISKEQRATEIKRLVEFAKAHESPLSILFGQLAEIKTMLSCGIVPMMPEPVQPKEMADADLELIKSILDM